MAMLSRGRVLFAKRFAMRTFAVLSVAGCLAISGCGDGVPQLSGHVTLDGSPLNHGQVAFKGDNLPTVYAKIQDDGFYSVKTGAASGILEGTYRVSVAAYETIPSKDPTSPPGRKIVTPKKYASPRSSGIGIEVKLGKNTFDISLVSDSQ